jgi:hypothetical protein
MNIERQNPIETVECGRCGWLGPEFQVVMPTDCRESEGCCPICESDDLGAIPADTVKACATVGNR